MLRQKDLTRFAQVVEISGRDGLELIERLEPARKNIEVAGAEILSAVGDKIQIKIVARRVVEVDSPDRNFSLARNHFDRRAFEPVLGKNFGGRRKNSLPARVPLPPMPLLDAHLRLHSRNE